MTQAAPVKVGRLIEWLLAAAVGAGLIWSILHLVLFKYLPTPFFYEPQDTWMDWFNTAYWAHQPGAYDTWGTIYPPLSFVVLKFVTFGGCYPFAEQYSSRDCDTYGAVTLHLFYLLNVVLIAKTFLKIDRRTALPRAFAMAAGLPMVFALERGNIILLCFTCLMLAYGPLLRSARLRWLFAALAINFKVYLIGSLFAQLLKRRWRWFEGATLATILVYLLSFAIIGAGAPWDLYNNIVNYSGGFQAASALDLLYANTYRPLISLLKGEAFPILNFLSSRDVDLLSAVLPMIIFSVFGLIALAALAAAFRPETVPMYRLVFLSIAAALITSEAGGYTQMFLILFVFMEPWRGFGRIFAIVTAYLLCIPAELPIGYVPSVVRDSFLGGTTVTAQYAIGLGPFLRPGMIMAMSAALALVTLRDIIVQLRAEGWRLPFAERDRTNSLLAARQPPPGRGNRKQEIQA
jgi:hypothetical protein